MRRVAVGWRYWVQGVGCACRRWWILRLALDYMVTCAPLAPGCGAQACLLRWLSPETPLLFFFQIPASVGCPDLVRVVSAC